MLESTSFRTVTLVRRPTQAKYRQGPHLVSSQNPRQSCREDRLRGEFTCVGYQITHAKSIIISYARNAHHSVRFCVSFKFFDANVWINCRDLLFTKGS